MTDDSLVMCISREHYENLNYKVIKVSANYFEISKYNFNYTGKGTI